MTCTPVLGPRAPNSRKRNVARKWILNGRVHQLHRKYSTFAPNSRKHARVVLDSQMSSKFATAEGVVVNKRSNLESRY